MARKHEECRVCGFTTPEPIITLPNYPRVAGPVTQVPRSAPTCDLEVGLCPSCGTCVSLNVDTDGLVYDDDYTSSGIAYGLIKSMDEQTDRFLEFIKRAGKAQGSKVLEVGCYDGTLMELLKGRYGFDMLGCEPCAPAASDARRKGHDVYPGVFHACHYSRLDMVVARNVLEHIASPSQLVGGIALVLKRDGAFVLEVPAGEHYIRNGILGTIVPQHSCYFGKDSLERLLGSCFKEIEVEEDKATIRARASFTCPASGDRETSADTTSLRIGGQVRQRRYEAVRKAAGDGKVGIFGANTCTLELLAAGAIRLEQIDRVYDDDPRKWGRYLVNTNLIVRPRSAIGERQKVLVCSYTHRQPIANYITEQNNIAVKLYGDDE